MIPKNLEGWTLEVILEIIKKINSEGERYDFKAKIPVKETLTKVCCAFANSKGGFVILGVIEDKANSSFEIVGIDNDKELAHKFGQNINANPTIWFSLPKILPIPDSKKVVAIFEIPLSQERPHVPNLAPEKRLFLKRTNKGNDHMNYEEIKFSFQDYNERKEKIKLLYLELLSNLEQLNALKIKEPQKKDTYSLLTLDNLVLDRLLVDIYSSISKEKELVIMLFDVRKKIKAMNNKINIFFSQMSLPLSSKGQKKIIQEHNNHLSIQEKALTPSIKKTMALLESKFNLKDPFN